jgi:hypothetical protein
MPAVTPTILLRSTVAPGSTLQSLRPDQRKNPFDERRMSAMTDADATVPAMTAAGCDGVQNIVDPGNVYAATMTVAVPKYERRDRCDPGESSGAQGTLSCRRC